MLTVRKVCKYARGLARSPTIKHLQDISIACYKLYSIAMTENERSTLALPRGQEEWNNHDKTVVRSRCVLSLVSCVGLWPAVKIAILILDSVRLCVYGLAADAADCESVDVRMLQF